jgi:hypothetical protein
MESGGTNDELYSLCRPARTLGLTRLPDGICRCCSTFLVNRHGRVHYSEIFQQLFEAGIRAMTMGDFECARGAVNSDGHTRKENLDDRHPRALAATKVGDPSR